MSDATDLNTVSAQRLATIRSLTIAANNLALSDRDKAFVVGGKSGAHIRLSPTAYLLIEAIRSGTNLNDLASYLNTRPDRRAVSAEDLEAACDGLVAALDSIEAHSRPPAGFWLSRPFISSTRVAYIAKWLTGFYSPTAFICWVLLIWSSLVIVGVPWLDRPVADSELLAGYALFLMSLVVHEFGHAAACARFGIQPGEIGFTMYLMFPALYSDVNRAWTLTRTQRIAVDAGGNYFQLVVGAVYLFVYEASHETAFLVASMLIAISVLFSLNPVFKCDGYWLFADALGVTNLSRQPRRIWRHISARIRGQSVRPLPWPTYVMALLLLYSAVSLAVWWVFIVNFIPHLWTRATTVSGQLQLIAMAFNQDYPQRWWLLGRLLASLVLLVSSIVFGGRLIIAARAAIQRLEWLPRLGRGVKRSSM